MSTLKADTIQSTSGGAATLTNQHAAKAWSKNKSDNTALLGSFNISSLDDDGTGDLGLHLTSAMSDANYSITLASNDMAAGTSYHFVDLSNGTQTTSAFDLETGYVKSTADRTNYDNESLQAVHGDLA
jgi:hypothetical protein